LVGFRSSLQEASMKFEALKDYIAKGREIEFSYQGEKYSIYIFI